MSSNTILLSIHTRYVRKILYGSKKYEFRKWKLPHQVEYIYIYSSGIDKVIIGYFKVSGIHSDTPQNIWKMFRHVSGITLEEYVRLSNCDMLYAIEINDIRVYKKYLSLSEVSMDLKPPQKFKYLDEQHIKSLKQHMERQ